MELDDLRLAWATQDKKLEELVRLNKELLMRVDLDKSKSTMRGILMRRVVEAAVFVVILVYLWGFVVAGAGVTAPTISALILIVFATIGLAGNVGQIVLISQIDYGGAIASVQSQIHSIRRHSLNLVRLILLSVPFYLAYVFLGFQVFFGVDLYVHGNAAFLLGSGLFSVALMLPSGWLVGRLGAGHIETTWIRSLAVELGGRELAAAAEVLDEVIEADHNEI